MNINIQKVYYYVVCAMAFFVLLWGLIDFCSAGTNILLGRSNLNYRLPPETATMEAGGESFGGDVYQDRMLYDRLLDGIVRIIIPGLALGYFSYKIKKLEGGA